ncbi:MAG: hypothetical protein KC994_00690 [Candidatus Omnitrophica bacterium]|nr:hypothetical protein [Candidatus Omnitrophota bacterium]
MRKVLTILLSIWTLAATAEPIPEGSDLPSFGFDPTSVTREADLGHLREMNFEETVLSETETLRIVRIVSRWMDECLGLSVRNRIDIRLLPIMEPSGVSKETSSPTLGAFEKSSTGGALTIRRGLSRRRMIQVVAHEWTHVWQAENCPSDQDLLIHEGFAQWVTENLLETLGLMEDLNALRTREDFYGEAYRWAAECEKANGREGLIEYVRKAR